MVSASLMVINASISMRGDDGLGCHFGERKGDDTERHSTSHMKKSDTALCGGPRPEGNSAVGFEEEDNRTRRWA
jgi:hypothetical protein